MKSKKLSATETLMEDVLSQASAHEAQSPEFTKIVDNYHKLSTTLPKKEKVSIWREYAIPVLIGLGPTVVIVVAEVAGHAITSKALSFARPSQKL